MKKIIIKEAANDKELDKKVNVAIMIYNYLSTNITIL